MTADWCSVPEITGKWVGRSADGWRNRVSPFCSEPAPPIDEKRTRRRETTARILKPMRQKWGLTASSRPSLASRQFRPGGCRIYDAVWRVCDHGVACPMSRISPNKGSHGAAAAAPSYALVISSCTGVFLVESSQVANAGRVGYSSEAEGKRCDRLRLVVIAYTLARIV